MNTIMKDAEFMTIKEKEKVLKAWTRFIKGGCKFSQFTKSLYNHLIMHCMFIAHYDRFGFYNTYFNNEKNKQIFFSQFDKIYGCKSIEMGSTMWLTNGNDVCQQYYDINNAMVDAYMDSCPICL
jgi:hypothetical protein